MVHDANHSAPIKTTMHVMLFTGTLRRRCGFELFAHPFLEGLHVLRAAEEILHQSIGGDGPARLQYSPAIAHWSWSGEQVLVIELAEEVFRDHFVPEIGVVGGRVA